MFTKTELQAELRQFMTGYACSIGRIYGGTRAGVLLGHPGTNPVTMSADQSVLSDTPLWMAVSNMYDYGIQGLRQGDHGLGDQGSLDGDYADVELFLRGLDSLMLFLEEDAVPMPRKAIRVVRTAVARHVLDGGTRWTDYEDGELEALSLSEVALLADMDERSVRNAANPKLAKPLVTASSGKRTYVAIEDARKWLEGRKGFIPTQPADSTPAPLTSSPVEITLAGNLVRQLNAKAASLGVTVETLIARLIESSGEAS